MKKLQFFLMMNSLTIVLFNYSFAAVAGVPVSGSEAATGVVKAVVAAGPEVVAASSGSQVAVDQALAKGQLEATPLFSATPGAESKISCFTLFFSLINTKTPKVKVGLGVDAYIKFVLQPVLESTTLTSNQLSDTSSMLGTVIAQVSTIEPAADKPPLSKLMPYKDKLASRMTLVTKINEELVKAAALPNDPLDKKIATYTTLLSKVDSNMLDSARQEIIKGIGLLYTAATKGTAEQRAAIQKMVPLIAVNNSFTQVEKHNLTTMLIGGAVTQVDTLMLVATGGGGADNPSLATVFKNISIDANKQPVPIPTQCQNAQNALPLITAASSAADKNLFITLANNLCAVYFTMNVQEIGLVESFCTAVLNNTYIVPVQHANTSLRDVLRAWINKLKAVRKIAEFGVPLLKTLKDFANIMPFDLAKCLKVLEIGMSLLAGEGNVKLPPAETDQKNSSSLMVVMRNLLGMAYAKRSSEHPALMIQLAQIMTAKNAASLSISPAWIDNITFLNKVLACQALAQTKALEAIQNITVLVKNLRVPVAPATTVPVIDNFEIGVLVHVMTSLYGSRATRAQIELKALQNVCSECSNDIYQKIFNASQRTTFARWASTLSLLNALSNAENETKIGACLALLQNIIKSLVDPASVELAQERGRFVAVLQRLFDWRGLWTTDEVGRLRSFLQSLQSSSALMALLDTSQKEFINSSISACDSLFRQVSAGSSGAAILDRLLEQPDDIAILRQVLVLMVDSTTASKPRLEQFVKKLNSLITKSSSDRAKLIELLRLAAAKKITSGLLLTDKQIKAINAAVDRLQKSS